MTCRIAEGSDLLVIVPHSVYLVAELLTRQGEAGRRELTAIYGPEIDVLRTANSIVAATRFGAVFMDLASDTPVGGIGAAEAPELPGLWSIWSMATGVWLDGPQRAPIGMTVTRWVRETFIPRLIEAGAERAQAWCLAEADGRHVAHAWLTRLLHARAETRLPGGGVRGEMLVCYGWTPESIPAEWQRKAA